MTVNPLRAPPRDVAPHRAISSRIQPWRFLSIAAGPLLASAVAAAIACSARADEYWAGTSGNWDDSLWSATPTGKPGLPPPASGNAFITFNDGLTRTVTYADTTAAPALATFQIGNA